MTWRRFSTLLRHLPADSNWVRLAGQRQKPHRVITDQAEAERYFASIG